MSQPRARRASGVAQDASQTLSAGHTAALGADDVSNSMSPLERHLWDSMRAAGLPEPEREYKFHPTRKFRLDFAWPTALVAVEIEGGIYRGGGHTSVKGIKRDIEKSNALTLLGWRLLRFHGDQVRSGEATETIAGLLARVPQEAHS